MTNGERQQKKIVTQRVLRLDLATYCSHLSGFCIQLPVSFLAFTMLGQCYGVGNYISGRINK